MMTLLNVHVAIKSCQFLKWSIVALNILRILYFWNFKKLNKDQNHNDMLL